MSEITDMSFNRFRTLVSKGFYLESLSLYTKNPPCDYKSKVFCFPFILKACAKLSALSDGRKIHAHVLKTCFHEKHTETALVSMYAEIGSPFHAYQAFGEMSQRGIESFNALIAGFVQNGFFQDAVLVFRKIQSNGFQPNSVTIASLLPACSAMKALRQGLLLHAFTIKSGFESDLFVGSGIVTMYAKCGDVGASTKSFSLIPDKNVVCYNAMLSVFLNDGCYEKVIEVFMNVKEDQINPNSVTLVSLLASLSELCNHRYGREVHCYVMKSHDGVDLLTGTALIDMYSKCGFLRQAISVFTSMASKNVVAWNAMISAFLLFGHCEPASQLFQEIKLSGLEPDAITWNLMVSGFAKQGLCFESLRLLKEMQLSGIEPNVVSLTNALRICSSLTDIQRGREIHGYIVTSGLSVDVFLETALVDMYAKCGCITHARRVFDGRQNLADTALWNAIISGYARNGDHKSALTLFDCMKRDNLRPNSATFACVLSLCSHAGLVDRGWEIFSKMTSDFLIEPSIEHYTCMVDLFCRSGKLDHARVFIKQMPMEPSPSMLATLLGSCSHLANAEVGEEMARELLELEPENPAPLVVLSNIYAKLERWMDVERLREMVRNRGMKKVTALSTVVI